MIKVEDYLIYLEETREPLSADVYFIRGNKYTYIFDVGSNKDSRELIDKIDDKIVIISHFHQDHIGNMRFVKDKVKEVYLGDYTYKILGYGNVIKDIYEINDGINIKIISIPNSHAKGSLCVIINNKYLLIGDALYSNRYGYNVSLLNEQLKLLKKLEFEYVISSHKKKMYSKDNIIHELEYYYSKRSKDKPYISLSDIDDILIY